VVSVYPSSRSADVSIPAVPSASELFSLLPTSLGLTLGGTVTGDPAKDIIRTAFENGINMIDTAEEYSHGNSEIEMSIDLSFSLGTFPQSFSLAAVF
jgi:hypothetical protein